MSDGQLSALCSVAKMDEVELLLHGLELGHLVDVMAVSIYCRRLVESLIFICPASLGSVCSMGRELTALNCIKDAHRK